MECIMKKKKYLKITSGLNYTYTGGRHTATKFLEGDAIKFMSMVKLSKDAMLVHIDDSVCDWNEIRLAKLWHNEYLGGNSDYEPCEPVNQHHLVVLDADKEKSSSMDNNRINPDFFLELIPESQKADLLPLCSKYLQIKPVMRDITTNYDKMMMKYDSFVFDLLHYIEFLDKESLENGEDIPVTDKAFIFDMLAKVRRERRQLKQSYKLCKSFEAACKENNNQLLYDTISVIKTPEYKPRILGELFERHNPEQWEISHGN
ncbi:hypothetical protein LJB89_02875 [Tyzzerella sp. OttesenSCG-928-J15]|nr:hypothetical protein [Tyzzerella sp. OttesenSCG-928-J15]